MKHLFSFLFLISFVLNTQAQGTIIDITVSPSNPTSTDTIYIYADLRFTSSDCELDNMSHAVSGLTISASAHHCLGIATTICSTVDTFKINPLPDGNYNFDLVLTSGGAPAPCTPGIIQDDDSTFMFTVGNVGPSGLEDQSEIRVAIYPNPIQDKINMINVPDGTVYSIIGISGQVFKSGAVENNVIDNLETLPTGLYFIKLNTQEGEIVRRISKS